MIDDAKNRNAMVASYRCAGLDSSAWTGWPFALFVFFAQAGGTGRTARGWRRSVPTAKS
jgi:hypothetical protein